MGKWSGPRSCSIHGNRSIGAAWGGAIIVAAVSGCAKADSWHLSWLGSTQPAFVQAEFKSESGKSATVEIEYPWWKVQLVGRQGGGDVEEGVPYDWVYHGSVEQVRRDHAPGAAKANGRPITIDGFDKAWVKGGWRKDGIVAYRYQDIFYTAGSDDASVAELTELLRRSMALADSGAATAVVPRIAAEQWVLAEWIPLTCVTGAGVTFRLAPADTIVLRFSYWLMGTRSSAERVEVYPLSKQERRQWVLEWRETGDPVGAAAGIVLTSQRGTVESPTVTRIPRPHFGDGGDFVVVARRAGVPDGYRRWSADDSIAVATRGGSVRVALFTDLGSAFGSESVGSPMYERQFTMWPIDVTLEAIKQGVRAAEGYPGTGEVPAWAVGEARRLGMWGAAQDSDAVHWRRRKAKNEAWKASHP